MRLGSFPRFPPLPPPPLRVGLHADPSPRPLHTSLQSSSSNLQRTVCDIVTPFKQYASVFDRVTSMDAPGNVPWQRLQPELIERVASFLPPNHVATGLRGVNQATWALFKRHIAVRCSQSVPYVIYKSKWTQDILRQLSLQQRQMLVSLTASSGMLENLKYIG